MKNKLLAGMACSKDEYIDICGKCGVKLPKLWTEGFCSIKCFMGDDNESKKWNEVIEC